MGSKEAVVSMNECDVTFGRMMDGNQHKNEKNECNDDLEASRIPSIVRHHSSLATTSVSSVPSSSTQWKTFQPGTLSPSRPIRVTTPYILRYILQPCRSQIVACSTISHRFFLGNGVIFSGEPSQD